MYVSALAPRPDEAGFWKNCTRRLQWPCFPQQVLVLSWFVFFLCFSVRKASRLIFSLLMQLFSSFLNLKLPMNLVKKKKKRQNERYFSKSDGQLSILLHLSHPSWPICGRRRRWGGSRSWGGGGAGDGVKDTSRAPLCKGSGLIPNVSTGVMSLKSVFSACGQAS